jgi:acetylornithine deacetylase/succinyl-diaminopimelate desuccinylase-like protein
MTDTDTKTPVDPWAFLEDAVVSTDLATVKAPTPLADIPNMVRLACEKALIEAKVMKVRFPTEKMAKDFIRLAKAYALAREATAVIPAVAKADGVTERAEATVTGPVTIRPTLQNDKTVIHFTVKAPFTPTPTAATAAQAVAAAEAKAPQAPAPTAPKGRK